ncbi:MAG: hypothetical protein IMY72_09320 [Bacteroidetes bacterium]|nr:hypothetical protein [Bacteroidota bacterium]
MKKILTTIFLLSLLISIPTVNFAQCKNFTRKKCMPQLSPYIYNGQLNSAILNEGDVAELMLTFYSNQDYRILVCAEENLGNIGFRLLDAEKNLIFDNKDHDYTSMWDFSSNSTQQLIVEITVPENDRDEKTIQSGCVSILIGFMSDN